MSAQDNPQDLDMQNAFQNDILERFIDEFQTLKNQELYAQNPLYALIDKTRHSLQSTHSLTHTRAQKLTEIAQNLDEPMTIAIIGQFSSGKSTFLNALLGEEILPSGITPITAKICKIVYGPLYKLEIVYKDGSVDTKPIAFLQEVDKAQNAKISLFKLFAPLPILKQIHFLDTPGFNSQNQSDTQTTNAVLEKVDGIIWLTLIDNVGKQSEREILLTHIKRYAHKSLCILNQKDRLKNQDEIDASLAYAQKAFEGIFEKVIAISARLALKARNNKNLENSAKDILDEVSSETLESTPEQTSNQGRVGEVDSRRDSGIGEVLEFIHAHIIPTAQIAKAHTTCSQLRTLLHPSSRELLQAQFKLLDLQRILQQHVDTLIERSEQSAFFKSFPTLFYTLETLLNTLTQNIYAHLEKQEEGFIRQSKKFGFNTQSVEHKMIFTLPKERILQKLNNPDSQIYRDFLKFGYELESMGEVFSHFIHEQNESLARALKAWSIAKGNAKDSCEDEENIQDEIINAFELLSTKHSGNTCAQFTLYRQILSLNYPLALSLCLTHIHSKVQDSLDKYRKNPDDFTLFTPTFAHIQDELKIGFHFEFMQEHLLTQPLHKKAIWDLQRESLKLCKDKQELINSWIDSKRKALNILQSCTKQIKAFQKECIKS